MKQLPTLVICSIVTLATGCVYEDLEMGTAEQATKTDNALRNNALRNNALRDDALRNLALRGSRLHNSDLQANTLSWVLDTELGREAMSYIIDCALDANDSVTLTDTGGTDWTFDGGVGLTPEWKTTGLTEEGWRWVMGCTCSRINAFGIQVLISMRGIGHSVLSQLSTTESEDFNYMEAHFAYNPDFDTSTDPDTPVCMAWTGSMTQGAFTSVTNLEYRVCGQPGQCPSVHVVGNTYDCYNNDSATGAWDDCTDSNEPMGGGGTSGTPTPPEGPNGVKQVVTTYLEGVIDWEDMANIEAPELP